MMKKYRIREGSIADYARVTMVGLILGVLFGIVMNTTIPM